MKNICLLFCYNLILTGFSYQAFSADGWASVSDTTGTPYNLTGGAAGTTVTPTTAAMFSSYATSSAPYVIQVSGTIDLSSLSNHTVYVKSNKTIVGLVGTSPTIYGHLDLKNSVSNIIIQRVSINYNADEGSEDPWTDGITVQDNAHHIWINHCSVYNSPDGLLDIAGAADYVTVSWCKFFYQSGIYNTAHHLVNLIGSDDGDTGDRGKLHVTFHHNWWADKCYGRMPRVRFGQVHVYNNLYDFNEKNANDYCILAGKESQLLIENNYFYYINTPLDDSNATALIHIIGNYTTGCKDVRTRTDTVFTPPYDYRLEVGAYLRFFMPTAAGVDGVEPNASSVPTNLTATPTETSVILDWNDNPESVRGYNVYRSTTPGGEYERLTVTPVATSNYTSSPLTYGTQYYYVVTSVSATYWRESLYSAEVSAIPRIYGDYEINHTVDMNDVGYLSDFWLDSNCDETWDIDYNHDCIINFVELAAMAENWFVQ